MEAATPAKFDEDLAVTVLLLQESAPNPIDAARMIAALVRGILEGAGCDLPWLAKKPSRRGAKRSPRARRSRVTREV